MILRVTTREVVLDVIARDKNHRPVGDLAENEFQVFDVGKHADKNPKHILSMRIIDRKTIPATLEDGKADSASVQERPVLSVPRLTTNLQFRPRRSPGFTRS